MNERPFRLHPDGEVCVGRDAQVSRILASAFGSRATLLFGGRQSGKTTLMRRISRCAKDARANVGNLASLDAIVYVNMLALEYDAGPVDFFSTIARHLQTTCQSLIEGFAIEKLPSSVDRRGTSLESFERDFQAIAEAAGEVELRALFLLDESQRVLGHRFPRGFQDNLFALLFGGDSPVGDRIAMLFSGGGELYRFCEDETSPIGSRAAFETVVNLAEDG